MPHDLQQGPDWCQDKRCCAPGNTGEESCTMDCHTAKRSLSSRPLPSTTNAITIQKNLLGTSKQKRRYLPSSLASRRKLTKPMWELWTHPPYSPYLVSWKYRLYRFPQHSFTVFILSQRRDAKINCRRAEMVNNFRLYTYYVNPLIRLNVGSKYSCDIFGDQPYCHDDISIYALHL